MLVRFKLFVICVTGFVLLSGCSSKEPDIQVLCNWTKIGNYIIKWETNPPMDGALKVYVSDNPELFDKNSLACTADLKRGVTRFISNDNITRKYFLLSFNDKYFRTVSARWLTLDYVHNLRDLGGYFTADRKHMVRWGRVFRSGQLSDINELDSFRIANLKVKTIIDLRSAEDFRNHPSKYTNANIINIPILKNDFDELQKKVQEGRMRRGDAMLYLQDLYLQFIFKYSGQFGKALKLFADKENYPILFNCYLGKDQSGFLAAMLLEILGMPEETIIRDYADSWGCIRKDLLMYLAKDLGYDGQETITTLLSSNEALMSFTLQQIKKKYGSIDNYVSKELKISDSERDAIRNAILLEREYPEFE